MYASPAMRKKNPANNGGTGSPDEMQNRIDRLESLVLSLMTNGSQSAGPTAAAAAISATGPMTSSSISGSSAAFPPDIDEDKEDIEGQQNEESEVDQVVKSIGFMKVDNNKAIFVPEAHWYSILAGISEVKNWFSDHKKQFDETMRRIKASQPDEERVGTSFLFVTEKPSSKEEILRQFPPKSTCDILIARFFNTYNYDPAFYIIHGPTFQKQYDQHWMNPSETPVIWLGMAFAMMVIALQSFQRAGDEPLEYQGLMFQMLRDYRRLTAQSLALADPMQPINQMIETLILYVLGEFGRSGDADAAVLIGVSVIVRLASRMGYHRDSKHFPAISPFQGEMRRRLWTVVRQCDLLFSSQAGLPPMIRSNEFNTELPRNLYDDELHEDMKTLPPSRPRTEPTPMCYVIYKAQLVHIYGKIVEDMQSLTPTPYEQVMKLDQNLRETQAEIPPIFKMRPLTESLRDPSSLVMQRYNLDLLFLRAQCILHRKYMACGRENSRYSYSRRICVEAAMEMLRHQAMLHNESRPGGRLSDIKWYISSLTTNDFLLAAMVVCSDLYQTAEAERASRRQSNDLLDWSSQERRANMISAIEQSLSIWDTLREQSMEAFKACGVLNAMLAKLRSHEAQLRQQPTSFVPSAIPLKMNGTDDGNVEPEHSAAMTLGMLSTGALTPNAANLFAAYEAPQQPQATQSQNHQPSASSTGVGIPQQYMSGTGVDSNGGPVGPLSPFSSLFGGPGLAFQDLTMPNVNIDWVSCPLHRIFFYWIELTCDTHVGCLRLIHPGPHTGSVHHQQSLVHESDGRANGDVWWISS